MRRAEIFLVAIVTAGCAFVPSIPSPTPSPTREPTPPPPAVTRTPSPSPAPTPATGIGAVPRFAVGTAAVANAPGLRVRSRPGVDQRVVTTLGLDAPLVVGMGPVMFDDLGWYLVRDGDPDADPEFGEGWVAAGFEPDPFLVSSGVVAEDHPFLGGFAEATPGEYGPVALPDGPVTLRWIASTYERELCNFALDLSAASGDPVRAVRTPVGSFPASGELPAQFFASNPQLTGSLFFQVDSTCSWAVSLIEMRAVASPS